MSISTLLVTSEWVGHVFVPTYPVSVWNNTNDETCHVLSLFLWKILFFSFLLLWFNYHVLKIHRSRKVPTLSIKKGSSFVIFSEQNCSFWIPVTPVSKSSNLTYIGGSHKWGKWFKPKKFASLQNYKYTKTYNEKVFEDIPDIDSHPDAYNLLSWDLKVIIAVFLNCINSKKKWFSGSLICNFILYF